MVPALTISKTKANVAELQPRLRYLGRDRGQLLTRGWHTTILQTLKELALQSRVCVLPEANYTTIHKWAIAAAGYRTRKQGAHMRTGCVRRQTRGRSCCHATLA